MNTSGEAADQVVRMSLEVGEAALKITGAGAKQLAVILYAVLKEQKKTKGRARLETLVRSGKPLTVYSVKESDLKQFVTEAKRYGILYCAVRNPKGSIDGMVDVVVKEEDAPRINRIVERFKFASVTEAAQIKTEIEKSREEKSHGKSRETLSAQAGPDTGKPKQKEEPSQEQKAMSGESPAVPQQERPEKSQEDRLMDELFGEPVKKEGKQQNPSLAKTEKSRLSEPISVRPDKTAEGTSKLYAPSAPKKPSVRKELREIQAARKKEAESKVASEKRATDLRLSSIKLKQESAKRSIDRLTELKKMDYSYSIVMDKVELAFSEMAKNGKLKDSLIGWIAEAAIGLDRKNAVVSYSLLCPVDDGMLRAAEALVKERTGASLSLSLDENKTSELGVIVSSTDGKISYNNLLSTRIRRYMKDIRKIVQEENAR